MAELGEVTTQALADHADLSAATVVMVLEKLEQRAIVERYRSTSDRRIVYTRLTAKGAELVSSTRGLFGAGLAQRLAALPAARRQELIENLGCDRRSRHRRDQDGGARLTRMAVRHAGVDMGKSGGR